MLYSNPPIYGARIVDLVLGKKELTKDWHEDLKLMSGRMQSMRKSLVQKLKDRKSPHNWNHIQDQIGMFAFTGLSPE